VIINLHKANNYTANNLVFTDNRANSKE